MSKPLELTGTVEDVFGHRFTMKTRDGKHLIDLGPEAGPGAAVQSGQQISVKGEQKPSEIKARRLRIADGAWQDVRSDAKDAPDIDDAHVTRVLEAAGYTDHGERTRKPKHVEVIASKDGKRHKVHVHKDGLKKSDPLD